MLVHRGQLASQRHAEMPRPHYTQSGKARIISSGSRRNLVILHDEDERLPPFQRFSVPPGETLLPGCARFLPLAGGSTPQTG